MRQDENEAKIRPFFINPCESARHFRRIKLGRGRNGERNLENMALDNADTAGYMLRLDIHAGMGAGSGS